MGNPSLTAPIRSKKVLTMVTLTFIDPSKKQFLSKGFEIRQRGAEIGYNGFETQLRNI
eukprot:UN07543